VRPVDPRLVAAMWEQLSRRPAGATRVGWKYGSGDEEQIGGDHVVGHLTSATTLADGDTYLGGGQRLQADVEVAVEIGDDLAQARYGVALEICDVAPRGTVEELAADNDYHRAVAFGPFADVLPAGSEGALIVNGEPRAAGPVYGDVAERVAGVARVLGSVGERLKPGDRLITGLIANTRVQAGDEVVAELGQLGRVGLRIG
jgi:hypothetical protein